MKNPCSRECTSKSDEMGKRLDAMQEALENAREALALHASALKGHQQIIDILLEQQKQRQLTAAIIN